MDKVTVNIQHIDKPLNDGKINYNSVIISNKDEKSRIDNKAYDVDISKTGKLCSEKNKKEAGTASARESFENSASEIKNFKKHKIASRDLSEIWKLDEPETWDKYVDCIKKMYATRTHEENGLIKDNPINSFDDLSDEGKYYQVLASSIQNDYYSSRVYGSNSPAKLEVDRIQQKIDELDEKFSNEIHDVAFTLYSGFESIDDMWQANTKYTVSLSKDMLNTLINGSKDDINTLMSSIDSGVKILKETDFRYEGNLDWLRFGVKLNDDSQTTYYANFTGCKEKGGIQANSADELLQMLMNYDIE